MKKLSLILAVMAALTMFTVPASAATQWNFGASLRYLSFWSERDAGNAGAADLQGGGARVHNDGLLDWGTQSNSRVVMYMQSDHMEGFIDMGYNVNSNKVSAREYWGRYRFSDQAFIAIGHQKQLFNQYISNQVWDGDLGMGGIGIAYQSAAPKITLGYGGFALALAKPYDRRVNARREAIANDMRDLYASLIDPSVKVGLAVDIDTSFPQLQGRYEYSGDAWRIKLVGAYQYIRINKIDGYWENPAFGGGRSFSAGNTGVHSWLAGLDGDVDFGPLNLAAATSFGQNWSDAGWNDETSNMDGLWTGRYMFNNFGVVPVFDMLAPVGGGKVPVAWKSTTSFMLSFVGAYRLTEALRFEAGAGYRYDRNGAFRRDGHIWHAYLQAAYTIAPGFTVTPEIGYIDFGKHVISKNYMGDIWYVGAQWRMDF